MHARGMCGQLHARGMCGWSASLAEDKSLEPEMWEINFDDPQPNHTFSSHLSYTSYTSHPQHQLSETADCLKSRVLPCACRSKVTVHY